MESIYSKDIEKMDPVYRLHLINSVTGFKSANLIGSKSNDGIPNLAVFSSVTHLGSNPPMVGFFVRPGDSPPDTYRNILETKSYTINHIPANLTSKAHQTSAAYSFHHSEFEKIGLNEEYTDSVYAPYVKECTIKLGMAYRDHYPVSINGTVLIVGEIVELKIPKNLIETDGHIDLNEAETVTISGLDAYHRPKIIHRLEYATLKEASANKS
ncbi:flavin reductase family protein [Rhodohalobacter sulfatireducens]|uniref:Flavin reductase family protein n=1 Tax=Rhodohalobacter sulfatireducens TaxID=2911366 RepID=A0ABS9KGZ1_9BACT|nr:flavin reductase [Rhodohalobacter sulfatireducens]MCG2590113.1 flavin reductase family protein [Rhodohalobacter sulfatireducens]